MNSVNITIQVNQISGEQWQAQPLEVEGVQVIADSRREAIHQARQQTSMALLKSVDDISTIFYTVIEPQQSV